MKRWISTVAAMALTIVALVLGGTHADAQALGPEGRAYAVETSEGRYTAQLRRGGRYEDSRGSQGSWSFDGRTVCMIVRPPRGDEYEACVPFRDLAVGEAMTSRGWTQDGSQARVTRVE